MTKTSWFDRLTLRVLLAHPVSTSHWPSWLRSAAPAVGPGWPTYQQIPSIPLLSFHLLVWDIHPLKWEKFTFSSRDWDFLWALRRNQTTAFGLVTYVLETGYSESWDMLLQDQGIWSEGTGFAVFIVKLIKIERPNAAGTVRAKCSVTMVNPNGSSRLFTKVIILLSTSLPPSESVRTFIIAAPTPNPFTKKFQSHIPSFTGKSSPRGCWPTVKSAWTWVF